MHMYVEVPVLEAAVPAVFMVWLGPCLHILHTAVNYTFKQTKYTITLPSNNNNNNNNNICPHQTKTSNPTLLTRQ